MVDWKSHPVYWALWLCAIPFWREFHFYWIHRAIHWPPLYRTVHYLHHKNINPGPWSGLAMHPVEHLLYFSVVLIHWVVPSHPIHFLFNAQHTALTPAGGHHGFEGPLSGKAAHRLLLPLPAPPLLQLQLRRSHPPAGQAVRHFSPAAFRGTGVQAARLRQTGSRPRLKCPLKALKGPREMLRFPGCLFTPDIALAPSG